MGEQESLVTILMTNYNDGRFIRESIESVFAQTYRPFEFRIIDDGSTDNSKEVIEKLYRMHQDPLAIFRKPIYLLRNVGINAALNIGIPLVEGYITIIFDADDIIDPRYVELTTHTLLENRKRGISFVYTDNRLIDENGDTFRDKDGKEVRLPWTDFDPKLLPDNSYIPGCAIIFTEALKSALPLDETIRKRTKHHRWKKIVAEGYMGMRIPEQLALYRMHGNNNSGIGKSLREAVNSGRPVGTISDYWLPVN